MELEATLLRERIAADLSQIGCESSGPLTEAVVGYVGQVSAWSRQMNLTGLRQPLEIARRLVLPAMAWSRLLPRTPETIADLGSGAGFPGVPLALCFPEARVYLVDARERRHHFQRHIVRRLKLSNVVPLHGRAEVLDPIECDVGVAQAFAPLEEAVFHVKRWTRVGGIIAIPQNTEEPASDDSDLEWLGCPGYPDPFEGRPSFLWMSRRKH